MEWVGQVHWWMNASKVRMQTLCCENLAGLAQSIMDYCIQKFFGIYWILNSWPWDHWLKICQGHSLSKLSKSTIRWICGIILTPLLLWVFYSYCIIGKFDLMISDLEIRSRSLIIELVQDPYKMHLWYKFGRPSYKRSRVIMVTSRYGLKVINLEGAGQGHRRVNSFKAHLWTLCSNNVGTCGGTRFLIMNRSHRPKLYCKYHILGIKWNEWLSEVALPGLWYVEIFIS